MLGYLKTNKQRMSNNPVIREGQGGAWCLETLSGDSHAFWKLFVPSDILISFSANCLPMVPEQGTVGASGDLAPLAHLALGAIGEGKMWSPKSGWADAKDVRKFCSKFIWHNSK